MKSNIQTPIVETYGLLKELSFSVGDSSIIFDILRNKIYSNPIEAIVREITANARDAHREIGKFNLPIKICLPNAFEPEFRVQDFGPGISPERIEEIYVKYGVSTKRDDNIQQGFFGIGAKSPFSLVNSFSIITITNEIKRTYCAFIDETRVGKIALTSEIPTDEGNGTTIVIPVKRDQVKQFEEAVHYFTQFWEVQPEIIGASLPPLPRTIVECHLGKCVDNYTRHNYNGNIVALIDGIPYRVDENSKILNYSYGQVLCVKFEIGELPISASRDNLQLTATSRDLIKDKVEACEAEIIKTVNKQIAQCSTYKEAVVLVTSLRTHLGGMNLKWKNLTIYDFNVYRIHENRLSIYYSHNGGKIARKDKTFRLGEKIRTLVNKSGSALSAKKVRREFENYPTIERLQVITYLSDGARAGDDRIERIKSFRTALEILADGEIVGTVKTPKKKKIIKKPKLIYSYLPNENKNNLIKSSFDYTIPQIYCPYDPHDNSVVIGSCFQVNSYKRLERYLEIARFLNTKIVAWDNSSDALKPPEHWKPVKEAIVEKFKTIPVWEDLLFFDSWYLDFKDLADKLSSISFFSQLKDQINLLEKTRKDNKHYIPQNIYNIVADSLNKEELSEIKARTIKEKINNLSKYFPLFDIVDVYSLRRSFSNETLQDLLTYLKSKDIQK